VIFSLVGLKPQTQYRALFAQKSGMTEHELAHLSFTTDNPTALAYMPVAAELSASELRAQARVNAVKKEKEKGQKGQKKEEEEQKKEVEPMGLSLFCQAPTRQGSPALKNTELLLMGYGEDLVTDLFRWLKVLKHHSRCQASASRMPPWEWEGTKRSLVQRIQKHLVKVIVRTAVLTDRYKPLALAMVPQIDLAMIELSAADHNEAQPQGATEGAAARVGDGAGTDALTLRAAGGGEEGDEVNITTSCPVETAFLQKMLDNAFEEVWVAMRGGHGTSASMPTLYDLVSPRFTPSPHYHHYHHHHHHHHHRHHHPRAPK